MSLMDTMRKRAIANPQRIAFPEANDPVMMKAIGALTQAGIARCYAIGSPNELAQVAADTNVCLDEVTIVDLSDETVTDILSERYLAHPTCMFKEKGVRRRLSKPLERALIMQALDDVDITFAGITYSTGDVILGGQTIIGLADNIDTISSMGIFDIPGWEGSEGNLLGFGDSAVCQNPNSEQLASIAISCCDTLHALTGWEPRCALLSYSTDGSGEGELVEKVINARDIAHKRRPDLAIDGEFQLDSAISPHTAERKVKRESTVAGKANLIVWPDLNVGNVGVKLVQQFAHANAYGPMLQGFKKIVCDCSRSADVDEIVGNIIMSCVRAQALKEA